MNHGKLSIGILCTSRGRSMDAFVESINDNPYYNISVIMTHNPDAPIIEKAAKWDIPCYCIERPGKSKQEIDFQLSEIFKIFASDLVLLVGYMRILSKKFVRTWPTINIHPSLLPKHKGLMDLDVHQAVLDNHEKQTGVTLHWVSEEVDEGPIIEQYTLEVEPEQTAEQLKAKVQAFESEAFIKLFQNPDLIDHWKQHNPHESTTDE
jgi:folate-dependent phosphoribosylglycinamide formyltransferase PurN